MASTLSVLLVVAHSNGDKYALKSHLTSFYLVMKKNNLTLFPLKCLCAMLTQTHIGSVWRITLSLRSVIFFHTFGSVYLVTILHGDLD